MKRKSFKMLQLLYQSLMTKLWQTFVITLQTVGQLTSGSSDMRKYTDTDTLLKITKYMSLNNYL